MVSSYYYHHQKHSLSHKDDHNSGIWQADGHTRLFDKPAGQVEVVDTSAPRRVDIHRELQLIPQPHVAVESHSCGPVLATEGSVN